MTTLERSRGSSPDLDTVHVLSTTRIYTLAPDDQSALDPCPGGNQYGVGLCIDAVRSAAGIDPTDRIYPFDARLAAVAYLAHTSSPVLAGTPAPAKESDR